MNKNQPKAVAKAAALKLGVADDNLKLLQEAGGGSIKSLKRFTSKAKLYLRRTQFAYGAAAPTDQHQLKINAGKNQPESIYLHVGKLDMHSENAGMNEAKLHEITCGNDMQLRCIIGRKYMKFLNNSDKHIKSILPHIIYENLGKKAENFKFIGGGSYGRVYKTTLSDGEIIAVKAYLLEGMNQEEAYQLKVLSEHTRVKMPQVLFTYEDDNTGILAMSFVEGQNVLNPSFLLKSKAQKQKFADEVTDGMLQWHQVKSDKYGALADPKYDTWYDYYQAERQIPWLKGLQELSDKGKFSKKKMALLYESTEIFNSLPQESEGAVLIHCDLNIMNIMADPKTFKLTGFIDPCGSIWADREYDLFQYRNMWGDAYGLYETYKNKCKMSEYTDFRVAYYGAMLEASMRLKGGHTVPLWEDLNFARLKREMKKLK